MCDWETTTIDCRSGGMWQLGVGSSRSPAWRRPAASRDSCRTQDSWLREQSATFRHSLNPSKLPQVYLGGARENTVTGLSRRRKGL